MKSLFLLSLFVCLGCAEKKPSRVIIPRNCMKITVTDFTKPCKFLDPNHVICDGVKVAVMCVTYPKEK